MKTPNELKQIVKEKYSEIAKESSCCCGNDMDYTIMSDKYEGKEGYNPQADLSLGCGIPTDVANIKEGDSVLDLGAGAGNDCFVARALVKDKGQVTGLDFSDEMLEKAKNNLEKSGYTNMEFIKGDIENIPINNETQDVIISNCVLNLVPDKERAFSEIKRLLKKGGHFCVSDIVTMGTLPLKLREAAALYAGCVSGALQKHEYLNIIKKTGFSDIEVKKQKTITIPDDILLKHLEKHELEEFKNSGSGIYSITVYGVKN